MSLQLFPFVMLVAGMLPFVGAAITSRTYRLDEALAAMPAPPVTAKPALVAMLITVAIMVLGPMAGMSAAYVLVMGPLTGLAFLTDAVGRILPDILTAAIALAGLLLSVLGLSAPLPQTICFGALICLGAVLVRLLAVRFRGPEAFCLGDVKLLMACGFAITPPYFAGALIMAAPVTLLTLLATPRHVRMEAASALPFGSVFVAGLAATIAIVAVSLSVSPNNDFLWSLGF